jgi:CO/xanthine dehydrogenase Mo-binding subunit
VLRHARTKRQGRFGQFAEAAARLPVPSNVKLKDPSAFRFIGKDGTVKKLDAAAKTNGKAQFTLDIRERGMLTVVVARPPRFGARVAIVDVTDARAVRGVIDVRRIPTGFAVYADGFWPAVKARDRLGIRLAAVDTGEGAVADDPTQPLYVTGWSRAADAGLDGVMDRCPAIEHPRLVRGSPPPAH